MAGNSVEDIKQARKEFLVVLAALAVFTVITVWISFFDFGIKMNTTIGMIIATVKASLVALIFMHLKSEKRLVYLFLLMSVVGFVVLMFLTLLHLFDPIAGSPFDVRPQ